ncbi:type VI secretion system-associated FHA domain protein TagH [Variovorax sp. J22P240]|uniref:type VI secretion system-associated FHA domain protein TagH n=1 Tax=Variovorax sp. J22P240 TaxID=3053514 RepID=UPI002577BF8F|nr:type VI secretion system-associated FHA domain protein TagH [Variovorax sp. J22P240]MDL9997174.1 type VI secretion system-associated FHA domain protein TagH [Variovorax sp. J22P240]
MNPNGPTVIALHVMRRPGATEPDATALPLSPEGVIIGRSPECDLVLADPLRGVSRQHAQVVMAGQDALVRCISVTTPLWVNDTQLAPGDQLGLSAGDRLRIGGFELAVECIAAPAAPRARLDRWFDLDGALDPLAAQSPLPALAPAPEVGSASEAASASAVVSWKTDPLVVRTGTPMMHSAPSLPPPSLPRQVAETAEPPRPATAAAAASTAPAPLSSSSASTAEGGSPDLAELAAAFGRGAGLGGAQVPPLTPELMEHLGALLRATAEGTLALLKSRAVAKRHMRAEGTVIAPRQNNPLKFSPDATEALTRMLQRVPSPGFLDPVAALRDANRDLLVHQVAMVAGMRAAVFELFSRLGPEAAENAEGPPRDLLARLPNRRAAALWERHRLQHAHLLAHLDDDFETIFGREFLRAYEAQSRVNADADAPPPEPPWPNAR